MGPSLALGLKCETSSQGKKEKKIDICKMVLVNTVSLFFHLPFPFPRKSFTQIFHDSFGQSYKYNYASTVHIFIKLQYKNNYYLQSLQKIPHNYYDTSLTVHCMY